MPYRHLILLCTAVVLASCASIGPATVRRDQVDYADAVGEAAKRQLLLNLVKLRYGDTPNFVTLSQLVAGYTRRGPAVARRRLRPPRLGLRRATSTSASAAPTATVRR